MEQPDLRERISGSLLGGAVGDALGAPIEFDSLAAIQRRFGPDGVAQLEPAYGRLGAITDDTQMTLFTAEGLVLAAQAGSLSRSSELARHVHRALLRWLRTQGSSSRHPTFATTSEGSLLELQELHSQRAPGTSLRWMGGRGGTRHLALLCPRLPRRLRVGGAPRREPQR